MDQPKIILMLVICLALYQDTVLFQFLSYDVGFIITSTFTDEEPGLSYLPKVTLLLES